MPIIFITFLRNIVYNTVINIPTRHTSAVSSHAIVAECVFSGKELAKETDDVV